MASVGPPTVVASTPQSAQAPSIPANGRKKSAPRVGVLDQLSYSCRMATKRLAQSTPVGHIWDNMNWIRKVAEQILGRKDAQENGTCATVFPLFGARSEDMKTADLLASYQRAPPLHVDDILTTPAENQRLNEAFKHAVLRIIVAHGPPGFARFSKQVAQDVVRSEDQIPVHKTEVAPLPTMNINESSIVGNADVFEAMFTELGHDVNSQKFFDEVRIVAGDQLSISNARSLTASRIGHDRPSQAYANVVGLLGLFHGQIHKTFGVLQTHWGSQTRGANDPGSLSFHNTVLNRKPIVLSSLPPYRTCKDLIDVSLYSRVLLCLERVAGISSLERYASTVDYETLRTHAGKIVDEYASTRAVEELREAREERFEEWSESLDGEADGSDFKSSAWCTAGDMVFENAVLFMRDALVLRKFNDAIKSGDSGRLVLILKILALSYRGCGRTKYAYEMLHLIHNIKYVWPPALR